jgi:hypothetical protein
MQLRAALGGDAAADGEAGGSVAAEVRTGVGAGAADAVAIGEAGGGGAEPEPPLDDAAGDPDTGAVLGGVDAKGDAGTALVADPEASTDAAISPPHAATTTMAITSTEPRTMASDGTSPLADDRSAAP